MPNPKTTPLANDDPRSPKPRPGQMPHPERKLQPQTTPQHDVPGGPDAEIETPDLPMKKPS